MFERILIEGLKLWQIFVQMLWKTNQVEVEADITVKST